MKHSRWKIQTATDIVIETYNPPRYNPTFGFAVFREPAPGGGYTIKIAMTDCVGFGCDISKTDIRRAFSHYVETGEDLLAHLGLTSIR